MTDTDDANLADHKAGYPEQMHVRIYRRLMETSTLMGGLTPKGAATVLTEELELLRKEMREEIAQAKKEAIARIPPQDPMMMRLD
jgi:hypothetical protein